MGKLDYSAGLAKIEAAQEIVVCGHINPDGDCIGSTLALTLALAAAGKNVVPLIADANFPTAFEFLEGYSQVISAADYEGTPDLFIAVDVPKADRTAEAVFERAADSLMIDHHQRQADWAGLAFIDSDAASASMLVWDALGQWGFERTPAIAAAAYAGLMTDTGSFRYQNADGAAFAAAGEMVAAGADPALCAKMVFQQRTMAGLTLETRVIERAQFFFDGRVVLSWASVADFEELGASHDDGEGLVDVIRSLAGIEVAVMLRLQDGFIRGSLRAKNSVDVSVAAKAMNGGGHAAAAGFRLEESLEEAIETVKTELAKVL